VTTRRLARYAALLLPLSLPSRAGSLEPAAEASPTPIGIPDAAIRGVLVSGPDVPAQRDPERLKAFAHTATGEAVDFIGHVESVSGDQAVVLGRRVNIAWTRFDGGGRLDLEPGMLVKVEGQGRVDGTLEAAVVTFQPERDAAKEAKIRSETSKFKEKYFKKNKRYADEGVQRYVARIGQGLVPPYLAQGERKFEFIVVEDPTPNAFALPDGTVVVHTGILARMENEAQLAAVLGHELAHVTQRHYVRATEHETAETLLSIGARIASVALALSKDQNAREAGQGIELISSALQSGYSRFFEDEADVVGLRYMFLSGYDVRQAPELWANFHRFFGDESPVDNFFYGSHSTAMVREGNLNSEIRRAFEPARLVGGRVASTDFLRSVQPAIRDNAVLEAKKGWNGWAEADLRLAVSANPDDAKALLALGQFLVAHHGNDSLADAVAAFRRAVELDPRSAEAHRALGLAYERMGAHSEARTELALALELAPEAAWAPQLRAKLKRLGDG